MLFTQLATVIFSVFMAWVNQWPVTMMRKNGATEKEEKSFHRANAGAKIFYACAVAEALGNHWAVYLILIVWLLLIQWAVFDIALNLLTDRRWDYNGQTAKLDKALRYVWGDHAGKFKAFACLLLIAALNIMYYK